MCHKEYHFNNTYIIYDAKDITKQYNQVKLDLMVKF